jgi:hypothetical protein
MNRSLLSLLMFLTLANYCYSQNSLTKSRKSSFYTYIYKLTDQEAKEIVLSSKIKLTKPSISQPVDSFLNTDREMHKKALPFGNYLAIGAFGNQVQYEFMPVPNVSINFLNSSKDLRFVLTDAKDRQVSDAVVKIGNANIKHKQLLNLYQSGLRKGNSLLSVKYNGISSFFKYELDRKIQSKRSWSSKRNRSFNNYRSTKDYFLGSLIFNKPTYRPNDTVRFKAYLVSKKGKSIGSRTLSAFVKLDGDDGDDQEEKKQVAILKPYRSGGYEGFFVLSDSSGLKVNNDYTLFLEEKSAGKWKQRFGSSFKYEDYLLTENKLIVRKEFEKYYPGEPVNLFIRATDANELPIADGRLEVVVKAEYLLKKYQDQLFVKDTLWTLNQRLDPVAETKITLPENIFPNAELSLAVQVNLLNSNNERLISSTSFTFSTNKTELKLEYKKDSVKVILQTNDNTKKEKVVLYKTNQKGKVDSTIVGLPVIIPIDQHVSAYTVKTSTGKLFKAYINGYTSDIVPEISHTIDSIKIDISNKFNIPFWYAILEDGKLRANGYSNKLDTIIKAQKSNSYAQVFLNYIWAGAMQSAGSSAFFDTKSLKISLKAPAIVYPGEVVEMNVSVLDSKNKPLPFADLTAYAHTSKFKDSPDPYLANFAAKNIPSGRLRSAWVNTSYAKANKVLDWETWNKVLGLDTIAFYQFINVHDVILFKEKTNRSSAIVVPFAIKDSQIDQAHLVYIDDKLVYYSETAQLKRYAFSLTPGKHVIRLRTVNYDISYEGVFEGKVKTILAIAADTKNPKANVQAAKPFLSPTEIASIDQNLIRVRNNFQGEAAIIEDKQSKLYLNPPQDFRGNQSLLVGPFSSDSLYFRSGPISEPFKKDTGSLYTFMPNEIVVQPTKILFTNLLKRQLKIENSDYTQDPLLNTEVDSIWNDFLDLRSSKTWIIPAPDVKGKLTGRLRLEVDIAKIKHLPYLKLIVFISQADPKLKVIMPGSYNVDQLLPIGKYKVMLIFKDNQYIEANQIEVLPNGTNYYSIINWELHKANTLSIALDTQVKVAGRRTIASYGKEPPIQSTQFVDLSKFDSKKPGVRMSGTVTDAANDELMVGANISTKVGGTLKVIGIVQGDGKFDLVLPKGTEIFFSFVSYDTRSINVVAKNNLSIKLKETQNELMEEVVIRGYTSAPGMRSSISIRGYSTLSGSANSTPIIILDGKVYMGKLEDIDQSSIASIETMEIKKALSVYGAVAANGVILIKSIAVSEEADKSKDPDNHSLRSNFSDYAIWEPKLQTNANGQASFKVKFPDNVTSWTTRVLAMNDHRQSGFFKTDIRSFKTLNTNLVSPQFALQGDSLNVIGKLMNYTGKPEQVIRKLNYNGQDVLNASVSIENVHLDTIALRAPLKGLDSLTFKYSLLQANGYSDGELRKIPLLKLGSEESIGHFKVFRQDSTINYQFDPTKGPVNIRVESSIFPVLLEEIEKTTNYEYMGNEQLASKLKSLLLESEIRKQLAQDFKGEQAIKAIIRKLEQRISTEGLWGWWLNSPDEYWISLHVIDAMMKAKASGYTVKLEETAIAMNITNKLNSGKESNQFYALKILPLLQIKYDSKAWITYFQERFANPKAEGVSLYNRLQLMQIMQTEGMPVDIKWLLAKKSQTVFGNIYRGDDNTDFWDNSIQNTLIAYQILKTDGHQAELLKLITGYFLEQRKGGQWRNTYESSLILETILPDLLNQKETDKSGFAINGEQILKFPYIKSSSIGDLKVVKYGSAPIYFTVNQQYYNPSPSKVSNNFSVNTSITQNGIAVKTLKAGRIANLKVEVEVVSDADYVIIEIPIPAGCTYENKSQAYNSVESHREYFKHKTSIFCKRLKKGNYSFDLELMPRFTGTYSLNPAKVEMMYFPVIYGREAIKKVNVD